MLRVASYNILADAYVRPSYFPFTPPRLLQPGCRRWPLLERIAALGADIVCLQEVEPTVRDALAVRWPGFTVLYEPKREKPDGVATLSQRPVSERTTIALDDSTGHVALLVVVEADGRRLGIANAHIKWDAPGADVGLRQCARLFEAIDGYRPHCDGWVVCGDFNATPASPLYALVRATGTLDAYDGVEGAFTCNSSRVPKRIDYLFHSPSLDAVPRALPIIYPETPLPSDGEPSDHLVVSARFRWQQRTSLP